MKINNNKYKGFTLIEVMIVVAILGIISAIALPSYVEYVKKGKRTDAKVELLKLAQLQESYFVQNLSYASTLAQLGLSGTIKSEQEIYTIGITKVPTGCHGVTGGTNIPCSGFTLNATPPTGSDTDCPGFTLSNTGQKGTTAGATAAAIKKCWK